MPARNLEIITKLTGSECLLTEIILAVQVKVKDSAMCNQRDGAFELSIVRYHNLNSENIVD